jgi:cardiolipin synthase
MWTTPNILTLARLALLVPICWLLTGGWDAQALAFVLYVLAAATDYADGYIARTYNQGSDLGRMLDPIVDKIFVAGLFVTLAATNIISGLWLACPIIILAREFLVSGLREYLGPRGVSLPVTQAAKWKTTIQMVALGLLIFPGLQDLGLWTLGVATALTVYTGFIYGKTAQPHFTEK